ncbi:dTDP-4-dehydrorhamnose reductase [Demequina sp. NBRC 110053]|uniref:dTDP-4-dehydrorhamnose reductase n=1 Tax=Demequina sp. NBRC 110053 TaxID=1570342 RepID=UPI001F400283|nr:dTDP-4-dehydrorhamnose reductase [Demequina sp. NBRC 110053]
MAEQSVRWLVLGAQGMLGRDLADVLAQAGREVIAAGRDEVDVADAAAVSAAVADADVVVNCAAYTDVDGAEADEEAAVALNATAAGVVARACASAGARLVHISTDYVFDGDADAPYAESHPVAPRSAYGRSKARGERQVLSSGPGALVVRTAWLYGAHGTCFPRTIARLAMERDRLDVVADQVGQPTWTRDLATFIVALTDADAPGGIYHGTASGQCSWFEFARAVIASSGADARVEPTSTVAFPRPAPRPAWSVLGHARHEALGVSSIGSWRERWSVAAPEVLGDARSG